jgi:hypothetical protein
MIASAAPETTVPREEQKLQDKARQVYSLAKLPQESLSAEVFCLPEYTRNILEKMATAINTEGPISKNLLCKRVLQSYGIARMGSRLERRFDDLLKKIHVPTTTHKAVKYFWSANLAPSSYRIFRVPENEGERRTAGDLPPEEVACAVYYVLQNQLSMSQEDLVREVYKELGYSRSGSAVEQAMLDGIGYAKKNDKISIYSDGIVSLQNREKT